MCCSGDSGVTGLTQHYEDKKRTCLSCLLSLVLPPMMNNTHPYKINNSACLHFFYLCIYLLYSVSMYVYIQFFKIFLLNILHTVFF